MKKLIAIGILIAMFLLGVLATRAQSLNVEDYSKVFTYRGTTHAIDRTSIQYLAEGRVVFWSAFAQDDNIIFTSMEVNCFQNRARIRAIGVVNSESNFMLKKVSNWLPKNDPIANRYIFVACH